MHENKAKQLWRNLSLVGLLAAALPAAGQAPGLSFEGTHWIWYTDAANPPEGVGFFRARIELPTNVAIAAAEVCLTADNLHELYVNGTLVVRRDDDPNAWSQPQCLAIGSRLKPGCNVIAVAAANTAAGPAGLLLKLAVRLADGRSVALGSDATWRCQDTEAPDWTQPGFDDAAWRAPHVVGAFGCAPWGAVAVPAATAAPAPAEGPAAAGPEPGTAWPAGVVFVGNDCSLYRPRGGTGNALDSLSVTIFNPRDSRAFPEHDLPAPMKVGHTLLALQPARPGVAPRVLLDAGAGAVGSPSVSFDGRTVYVSLARAGDGFFHIYRLPAAGGPPVQLTDGPFHDIDPVELPDGRLVFTSTRIGTFEEYHNPPSRSLYAMQADGRDIRPLTYTIIFDNEPEVLADGRVIFIRSDNFFDRGKVETLLHAVHPDGTEGYTEFGLDLGPEYGNRLRAFDVGSPAPLADGRVAFVTGNDIVVARPGSAPAHQRRLRVAAGDVAALPDGRLLCTLPYAGSLAERYRKGQPRAALAPFARLALLDPDTPGARALTLHDAPAGGLHSPVYLGPRPRPPVLADKVDARAAAAGHATGVLLCQNARLTRQTTAGWPHIRAIRVIAGKGLTLRSSHSYIVHAGNETVELGTVPLAPDGSFAVEVPADTAVAFQAVDAEGRSELNEMSWIYVRPGERRGCIGCHQPRQGAPPPLSAPLQAGRIPPLRLLGEGEPLRFRGNNAAVTGLMEMQFDRFREVAGINRHDAAEPLATGAQEVTALVARLRDTAAPRRLTAAQRLAVFRAPAAASALADSLRDEVREVRVAAALALAGCGTRASVAPLLAVLDDADPLLGQAADLALENLTGHAEPAAAFGRAGERARRAAAWRAWVAGTPWEQIEAGLIARLQAPDRDAARRAAVALGHCGGAAACAALRDYVARERDNNPYPAWRRQGHQGDAARFNALSPANPRSLQAAARALGRVGGDAEVPLLAETLARHAEPANGNLFLAEATVEALAAIGTPAAETALTNAFARLGPYQNYAAWYGDHGALIACHASPVHALIVEALDACGSARVGALVPHLLRAVPTDPDRALLPVSDDVETLTGRVIRRAGAERDVVETCLAELGDTQAVRVPAVAAALRVVHGAWAGTPDAANRAAQTLSFVCRDQAYAPRLLDAFERYRRLTNAIPRVFDTGIPVVNRLPARHWVCFYLARALGNLGDPRAVEPLRAALADSAPEAASGRPDPLGPGVLFLHNDLTPCWRAEVAWALGRLGDPRAVPALLGILGSLDNAPDTRHAAAVALRKLAAAEHAPAIRALAISCPEESVRRVLRE